MKIHLELNQAGLRWGWVHIITTQVLEPPTQEEIEELQQFLELSEENQRIQNSMKRSNTLCLNQSQDDQNQQTNVNKSMQDLKIANCKEKIMERSNQNLTRKQEKQQDVIQPNKRNRQTIDNNQIKAIIAQLETILTYPKKQNTSIEKYMIYYTLFEDIRMIHYVLKTRLTNPTLSLRKIMKQLKKISTNNQDYETPRSEESMRTRYRKYLSLLTNYDYEAIIRQIQLSKSVDGFLRFNSVKKEFEKIKDKPTQIIKNQSNKK